MILLQWCKTQIMCMLLLAYIQVTYVGERKTLDHITKKLNGSPIFCLLLIKEKQYA